MAAAWAARTKVSAMSEGMVIAASDGQWVVSDDFGPVPLPWRHRVLLCSNDIDLSLAHLATTTGRADPGRAEGPFKAWCNRR